MNPLADQRSKPLNAQESAKADRSLILCLCEPNYHWKVIPGYVEAFANHGVDLFCVGNDLPLDAPLSQVLKACPREPMAIFHFESALPLLPQGLSQSNIPTVCFQVDVYAYTEHRFRWSCLFDHAAVFHPGYDARFIADGHPGAFLLPHAARREFYDLPEEERIYDVGWVGQTGGALYGQRSRVLKRIAQSFATNDLSASYTVREVAEVYRRSRIVVNVGRDDFPHDANLRVFEALASGALLITATPTELTELGFQDGVHFATYASEDEVVPKIQYFLDHPEERLRISNAGRDKTLREHTYDQRALALLQRLQQYSGQKLAPARSWPDWRSRLIAVDFFVAHQVMDCATHEFLRTAGKSLSFATQGAGLLARGYARKYSHASSFRRRPTT